MRSNHSTFRSSLPSRVILALVLAALAAVVAVSPTLAGSAAPNYGSTVKCTYKTKSPGPAYTAPLKFLVVQPPDMFATNGQQTVGWRFVVRRTIDEGEYPRHKVTYRSPIQTAMATTTKAARFQPMSVGVALPKNVEDLRNVSYQVALKMLWYRRDGTIKSTTWYLMPDYTIKVKGNGWVFTEPGYSTCDAVQWAAV